MVASVVHQCMVKSNTHQLFMTSYLQMNYFSSFFVCLFVQSAEEMLTSHSKSLSGVSVPFSDITDGLLLVIIINIVVWARARVGKIYSSFGLGRGQLLGYGMLTQVVTDCFRNTRSLWLHALVIEAVYFTELVVEPRANRCPKRMLG